MHTLFHGTVKIHGSNITILFKPSLTDGPQIQSRGCIITPVPTEDCYGAAAFLSPRISIIKSVINTNSNIPPGTQDVMIAGEWAGKGIQENVAIAALDPFYTIFGIRVNHVWLGEIQILPNFQNLDQQ